MSCRHGCTLLAMMLGLLAPLGCVNGPLGRPITATVMRPPQPSGSTSELTPSQAAQLCLKTAEALEQKGCAAEAIRQYENARTHDPQLRSVSRHLAVLYDLQGDARRAEAEYLRAQQEQPSDAELLNDLGYFHFRHDRLSPAETWLQNAVAVDPNCRCAWINLGQVRAKQGRLEDSYQAFARVLRPAEAYSNLGVLLAKQGRTAEARTALLHAIELDPTLKQPQAFLSALPATPALLPPGLTRTASSPTIVPPTRPQPAVVQSTPTPPIPQRTAPPPPVAYKPPTPPIHFTPAAPRAVAPTPPPAVAQEPPSPLPIIRTVHRPSVVTYAVPQPPVILPSSTTPTILHTPASPRPAAPFILQVSPPTLPAPKTTSRPPEVIITDCQGE